MAEHNPVVIAWLLQAHFAMHRAGVVRLTRMPRATMGGEHVKMCEGTPEELRAFTDAAEAEAFIRRAVDEGDVVGIAWSNDEHHVFAQLSRFGRLLAERGELQVFILGPSGAARGRLRVENLPHAAAVLGVAVLFGLSIILEQEVAG